MVFFAEENTINAALLVVIYEPSFDTVGQDVPHLPLSVLADLEGLDGEPPAQGLGAVHVHVDLPEVGPEGVELRVGGVALVVGGPGHGDPLGTGNLASLKSGQLIKTIYQG